MKRMSVMSNAYQMDTPKRYCSPGPSSASPWNSVPSPIDYTAYEFISMMESILKQPIQSVESNESTEEDDSTKKSEKPKKFYESDGKIIQLKDKVIAIVDPKPRIIHKYALAALKKKGIYFAQSETELIGPFFVTPTPNDLPKGELVMIYECCSSKLSETCTTCFRPLGLFQN
ncbi:hypothetical protein B9Z55_025302 [Caenorhabditis nigoni]|uniref:Uncharacterized protein n=2 Tax=Caenorhabditis nigoni TaxID=1611254 RepID=A0A2G5SY97_9PELO|nr:hypothetical protein B9Z55_025302 [Caenorhabditis nigoni]